MWYLVEIMSANIKICLTLENKIPMRSRKKKMFGLRVTFCELDPHPPTIPERQLVIDMNKHQRNSFSKTVPTDWNLKKITHGYRYFFFT